MTKKRIVSEEEILFPNIKVGEIICKPWSFKKLFEIANILDAILTDIEQDTMMRLFDESGDIVPSTVSRLIFKHSNEIFQIIAVTIEKPIEFVETLSADDGLQFTLVIFQQNRESIKNVFTPLIGALELIAQRKRNEI
jgi:hypothetical protein